MLSALTDRRESPTSQQQKKKKGNQAESRQWNSTAQAHIKKVFMLRTKVKRGEPLIKVISKGKHAKIQNESKCIPANPSHSH